MLDGFEKLGLGLDHFRLNKFCGPFDPNYALVAIEIGKMAAIQSPIDDPKRSQFLQNLYQAKIDGILQAIDYVMHKDMNPIHVPGACKWILNNKIFIKWRESKYSEILYISADAGCGKSVMASFLVATFKNMPLQDDSEEQVCYFFFKDDNSVQQSAFYALRALLHQSLSERQALPKEILQL